MTLWGNPHSRELCFGPHPSQDLESNVNHPECFKAPGNIGKSALHPKLLSRGRGLQASSQSTWTPYFGLLGTVTQDDENGSLCQGLAFRDICEVVSS